MKFRFLVDNKTEDSRCQAEWGLSILIETEGKQILFDAGASPMFAENAARLGADLSRTDALVISHGHYDHTQGVPAFTACNDKALIYLHKDAMYETYGKTNGVIDTKPCGILWRVCSPVDCPKRPGISGTDLLERTNLGANEFFGLPCVSSNGCMEGMCRSRGKI